MRDARATTQSSARDGATGPALSASASASALSESASASAFASAADDAEFAPVKPRHAGTKAARERNHCEAGVFALARGWTLLLCCQGPSRGKARGDGERC